MEPVKPHCETEFCLEIKMLIAGMKYLYGKHQEVPVCDLTKKKGGGCLMRVEVPIA